MTIKELIIEQHTEDGLLVKTWKSINEAARELDLCQGNIHRSLDVPHRRCGGWMWKTSEFQSYTDRFTMPYEPTEEQRQEFNDRIPKYKHLLYSMIGRFDFIHSDNYEDYKQEALIYAWRNYHKFKHFINDDQLFGGWLKYQFKWGILNYREHCSRNGFAYTSEIDYTMADEEKEDDSMAYILAIFHCMEELSPEDRAILETYMNSDGKKEITEQTIVDALGISKGTFYKKFNQLKLVLKKRVTYYLHGIKESKVSLADIRGNKRGSPIEQFDLKGNLIAWYPNMKAANEKGFSANSISMVISNQLKSHKGYLWRLAKDTRRVVITDHAFAEYADNKKTA